ncbi:MAG: hypothetical protein LBH19_02400 [Dysgonamonadaceae bacterium]|jgi:hypothetical protein|nr:hypothetical protein [Dysgonamonadaceae bacterium]
MNGLTTDLSVFLEKELEQLKADIIARHESAGQVATGRTRDSFSVRMVSSTSGVLEGAAYAGALERGRGPLKNREESDFLERLKEWIVARGLDYGGNTKGLERLAKFLRWWINKNGTKIFRTGRHVDIFTTPMENLSDRISEQIGVLYSNEISNDLYNYAR